MARGTKRTRGSESIRRTRGIRASDSGWGSKERGREEALSMAGVREGGTAPRKRWRHPGYSAGIEKRGPEESKPRSEATPSGAQDQNSISPVSLSRSL